MSDTEQIAQAIDPMGGLGHITMLTDEAAAHRRAATRLREQEREIRRLRGELNYTASCVAAQTLDIKSLAKSRRLSLVKIINRMFDIAEGEWIGEPFGGYVGNKRARFADELAEEAS